jgi:hypothetical protein
VPDILTITITAWLLNMSPSVIIVSI